MLACLGWGGGALGFSPHARALNAICPKFRALSSQLGAPWPNGGGHGPLGRTPVSASAYSGENNREFSLKDFSLWTFSFQAWYLLISLEAASI